MIWFLTVIGSIPILGMVADHNHDAFWTAVAHVSIFGTVLLNYKQSRANGAKLKAAKVALEEKDSG